MARGRRPKPPSLHLVMGTFRPSRHGPRKDAEERLRFAQEEGKLIKPDDLTGHASDIWDTVIEPAWWLDRFYLGAAIMFCQSWQHLQDELDQGKVPATHRYRTNLMWARELGLAGPKSRDRGRWFGGA